MKYNQPHKADPIRSRAQTKEYREGWDNIFGQKPEKYMTVTKFKDLLKKGGFIKNKKQKDK